MVIKKRHKFFYSFFRPLVTPYLKWKFNIESIPVGDISGPCIILSNHNTDFDPLLIALSFPRQMYFVASEHIFRWGLASKLIARGVMPCAQARAAPMPAR